MGVYYLIIGIAVIFGIVNTLLMSVFERIREFGVLMAMGMKNGKVFAMIVLEAMILGAVGTVVGLLAGLAVYFPLCKYGLNLSAFAEGLSWIGVSSIVYPLLTPDALVRIVTIIPFISGLAALYPATKAIRLVPVRAIYYV
jgi:ABC-type antimicrobial peptide transport system permease subunit